MNEMSGATEAEPSRERRSYKILIPVFAVLVFLGYMWFVSGVLPWNEAYPNGNVKVQGFVERHGLADYQRTGSWITYHPNGQKASAGEYVEGEKVGAWRYWDTDGNEIPPPADGVWPVE